MTHINHSLKIICLSFLTTLLIACGGGGGGGATSGSAPTISFAEPDTVTKHLFLGDSYQNLATSTTNPNGTMTYSSSDASVATVANNGTVSLLSAGTTTITASVTAEGAFAAGSNSYTLVVTNGDIPFAAWVGSNNTEVDFPAITSGLQFYSETSNDCWSCGGYSFNLNGTTVTDTIANLNSTAFYRLANNSNGQASNPTTVSQRRFAGRMSHELIVFKNKLWLVGGYDNSAQLDIWSSSNGEVWTEENSSSFIPTTGIYDHQLINDNDTRLLLVGGRKAGSDLSPYIYTGNGTDNWSIINSTPNFNQRHGHQISLFKDTYWFTGGFNSVAFNDTWSSTDGITWTNVTPAAPADSFTARSGHQTAVFDGKLWLIGGYDGNYLNDIWSFDGSTWTQVVPNGSFFSVRAGHTLTTFNNKLWLIGGISSGTTIHSDIWSSTDGINWVQETTTAPFGARQNHSTVVFNNRLWLSGGNMDNGTSFSDEVWSSADGSTWVLENSPAEFTGRSDVQAESFNNQLWFFAGEAEATNNDIWSSDNGISWTEQTPAAFSARTGHQIAELNGTLWLSGGQLTSGSNLRDTWYSSNGTEWTSGNPTAAFPARSGHQMLSFGGQLWIFGGQNGSDYQNDVYSSSDGTSWAYRSIGSAPSGRKNHQAVVYGDKIWIIGGDGGSGLTNDVRAFDTTNNTWSTVTPAANFSIRNKHQVVAFDDGTGEKLFLIGGEEHNGVARVPANDIWTSTDGITWTEEPANLSTRFSARHSHRIVKHDGALYLIGGVDANGKKLKDVWKSSDGINWRRAFSDTFVFQ